MFPFSNHIGNNCGLYWHDTKRRTHQTAARFLVFFLFLTTTRNDSITILLLLLYDSLMSLFLASCGSESPSYLSTNRVWYVSLLQFLSMYSSAYTTFQTLSKRNTYWTLLVEDHTSSPSLFVQILLSAISPDLFISVCSYIPISYHLSLLFFILCSSFFFALPFFFFCSFVSNNYSWNLFPLFFS